MAWNEPGKNGQSDPWNRKRPGKSPLDDLLAKLKNRGGKFGQGSGGLLTGVHPANGFRWEWRGTC